MSSGQFFLGFLLVCLVQVVFCCGACAGKESKNLKINDTKVHGNFSQDSNNTKNERITNYQAYMKSNISRNPEQKLKLTSGNETYRRKDIRKPNTTPTMKVTRMEVKIHSLDHTSDVTTAHAQPTASPSITSVITQSLLQQNLTKSPSKTNPDSCTTWEQCPVHHHPKVQAWLHSLPGCPCRYPYGLYYNNSLYDRIQGKLFTWRNANPKLEKLAVFKPTAVYCIRQLLSNSATNTATQQCCYDRRLRLITRGSGSGTPNLVAPELDEALHNYVDLMPFISCQGDWTRYQAVRPPNNALKCRENPKKEEFWRQLKQAKEF